MEVEAAYVKAGSRNPGNRRIGTGSGIHQDLAGAHSVPDRQDAESNRPVPRVLPDRSIAIIHELVAVILELLSKVIPHRPGLVPPWPAQSILSCEIRPSLAG